MSQGPFFNPNYSAWEMNDASFPNGQVRYVSNSLSVPTNPNHYLMPSSIHPSSSMAPYVIDNRSVQPTSNMTSKSVNKTTTNPTNKGYEQIKYISLMSFNSCDF